MDIITVKDLIEVYADGTKAVDNISFDVKEGEFFGFLGSNDAGIVLVAKDFYGAIRLT